MEDKNFKFYVKVRGGKQQALAKTVYYKNEMTFDFFSRWRWYFEYRAALYKVTNPKNFVDISFGKYEYIPKQEELVKNLRNKIIAKKSKVTHWNNLLIKAKENHCKLFPIEDDEFFKRAVSKVEMARIELKELEDQMLKFL